MASAKETAGASRSALPRDVGRRRLPSASASSRFFAAAASASALALADAAISFSIRAMRSLRLVACSARAAARRSSSASAADGTGAVVLALPRPGVAIRVALLGKSGGVGAEPVAFALHLGAERIELVEIGGELVGGLAEIGHHGAEEDRAAHRGRARPPAEPGWPAAAGGRSAAARPAPRSALRDVRGARREAPPRSRASAASRRSVPAIWVSSACTRLLVSISVRLRVARSLSSASISARSSASALLGEGDVAFDRLEFGLPRVALGGTSRRSWAREGAGAATSAAASSSIVQRFRDTLTRPTRADPDAYRAKTRPAGINGLSTKPPPAAIFGGDCGGTAVPAPQSR